MPVTEHKGNTVAISCSFHGSSSCTLVTRVTRHVK